MTRHIPRTPNYVIISDVHTHTTRHGSKVLPAMSYVRPIELTYVPEHILDKYPAYSKVYETFCYTKYGIVPILKSNLREN